MRLYPEVMEVRPARPGDANSVAAVFGAARAEMTYLPQLHTPQEDRAFFGALVTGGAEVWIAEENGRVLGFAALGDDMLEHLYVDPGAQGRGIGSRLLATAKSRRGRGFSLWVFQQNEGARRFYERHGCRVVRLTNGRDNAEREPDALYEWRPSPGPEDGV